MPFINGKEWGEWQAEQAGTGTGYDPGVFSIMFKGRYCILGPDLPAEYFWLWKRELESEIVQFVFTH